MSSDTLRNALEQAGLGGCAPPQAPIDHLDAALAAMTGQKPNELKEKLLDVQHLLPRHLLEARERLEEALAMTDYLYHQNDPPVTDRAYQALEEAQRLLRGSTYVRVQSELQKAMKLLATEPSTGMVRGALKQARDLLAAAEANWEKDSTGWQIKALTDTQAQQRAAAREAVVMLDTVLED